jgi:imidazolonepropionase-like amidohydrolase
MLRALMFIAIAFSLRAETGSLTVYLLRHAIGEERYEIARSSDGGVVLNTSFEFSDRGGKRTTTAVLRMKSDYTPLGLETTSSSGSPRRSAIIDGAMATVHETNSSRTMALPERYFTIFSSSPFALQMMMMRYWNGHGKPASLTIARASSASEPIQIEHAGRDFIIVNGKTVVLDRYTIGNLTFGREILWMNEGGHLAAAMTFANSLPMEVVRSEYAVAMPELYRSGVAQEIANLQAISRHVPPLYTGTFAIAGATLVDGTGSLPLKDSVVIVRNGRVAAVGPRNKVAMPPGVPVIAAQGQMMLPGLWEMHIHFSGVEIGPALLAAGITTARDCGGEFDYLVAQRDAVATSNVLGPRLLLAGLVDGGGPKAYGHVTADTAEEGREAVRRYHDADFQQIKLFNLLTPEVVRAITAEAHRLGMTVTGHVPQALTLFDGIASGMDQINHLMFVAKAMRPSETGAGPIDVNSEAVQNVIRVLKDHRTVVDPTIGWAEMSGSSKEVDVASFEPGITKAPLLLESSFRRLAAGSPFTAEQMRARTAQNLQIVGALHKAGVPIVPGSDTGLVGHGLHRELELYVQAGMTPMQAIQSATIVSARAMNLDRDSGTVEPGKRADLILIDGNPLVNISEIRKVSRVVVNGRLYDAAKLWKCVGFRP